MKVKKYILYVLVTMTGHFVSGSALAVPYELPTNESWYQLQEADTYRTVCSSSDQQSCNVPVGTYVLLEFAGNGETIRTPVVVEDIATEGAEILQITSICTEASGASCNAFCPIGYLPSGVSCASQTDSGESVPGRDLVGRFDNRSGFCESRIAGLFDFDALLTLACVKR